MRYLCFLFRLGIYVGLLGMPLAAFAANVEMSITVPMVGKNYTVSGSVNSIVLSGNDLKVTLNAGENITVESPDKTKLTFPDAPTTFTETCGSSVYSVRIERSSGSAQTFTMTPTSTTCGGSGGGGGGGTGTTGSGGGGGGGGPSYAAITTPTPTPTPKPTPTPAPAFAITSDLAAGSQSNQVAQLQAYLASDSSLYPEGLITGYFGPATQRAVKLFQAKYGLPQVGRVGPQTRAKLAEIFGKVAPVQAPTPAPTPVPSPTAAVAFTKTLGAGSRNSEVTALQEFLAKDSNLYPEGTLSGYFGSLTRKAVERFQEKYGIAKAGDSGYGTVGPKTRAKLNELLGALTPLPAPTPAPTTPTPTTSADDAAKIKILQDQLKVLQEQLKTLQSQNP